MPYVQVNLKELPIIMNETMYTSNTLFTYKTDCYIPEAGNLEKVSHTVFWRQFPPGINAVPYTEDSYFLLL